MAQESWTVLCNRQVAGTQFPGGKTVISKAEAEAASNKNIAEKVTTLKPVDVAKVLTIEANSETEAALAAGYLFGFSSQALGAEAVPPKVQLVKTASLGEKNLR